MSQCTLQQGTLRHHHNMNQPVRSSVNECEDCGNEFLSGAVCPSCDSSNVREVELIGEEVSRSLPGTSRLRSVLSHESSTPVLGAQIAFGFGGQAVHPSNAAPLTNDSSAPSTSVSVGAEDVSISALSHESDEGLPSVQSSGAAPSSPPPKAAVVSVQTSPTLPTAVVSSPTGFSSPPTSARMTDDSYADDEDPFLSVDIVDTGPSVVEVSHEEDVILESLELDNIPQLPPPVLLESVLNDSEHASAMRDIIGLLESGRSSEAASILIPWAKKHPSDPRTLSALGIALLEDGKKQALGNDLRERRFEQAERTMRRCAELRSSDTRTLVNLAFVYEATEDHLREEKVWETVLKIEPEHAVAHLGLARLCVRIGDHARAIESLKVHQQIIG